MLDVHAPHHSPDTARDFFFHLFTITIGLLIALGLEGAVEWQHHRHLAHDAEASMSAEIRGNAKDINDILAGLHHEQDALKHDVVVLNEVIKTGKLPEHSSMEIRFNIRTFDSLAWTTAQTTGALSYMPYDKASEFSEIYKSQDELTSSEDVAGRDTAVALAPFLNIGPSDPDPTSADAKEMKNHIETLQGQLLIVDSFMQGLEEHYKKFLAAHPN